MKVCTCLNPLHTFLAVSGCLLGYTLIADEMKDEDLLRLVKRLGYEEGLPVVVDPGIIKPRDFIDEVVNIRIPNPFMPDTPQRIACDTSQKLSIRFGETIKGYLGRSDLDVANLKVVPLVFALWLRYLTGIGDDGKPFELSPDPLLEECKKYVPGDIDALLHRAEIFGVDLFEAGLAESVKAYFAQLNAGNGSVRKVLQNI
jgi:fructuronate reductase